MKKTDFKKELKNLNELSFLQIKKRFRSISNNNVVAFLFLNYKSYSYSFQKLIETINYINYNTGLLVESFDMIDFLNYLLTFYQDTPKDLILSYLDKIIPNENVEYYLDKYICK